ncbi:MAG TPA: hypothetical protein DCF65_13745 [Chloroflexi bacterium]|nr:hypothetical protein [Chloroflexota bacterium]HAF18483.1 hypothetical protein [Chloroflexota bacterium]
MSARIGGLAVAAVAALVASSVSASASASPIVLDDSQLQASTITVGGASPLNTTQTVQHWFGQTLDPHNGITYGYNMVGADPSTNGSATIQADITPLIVNVGGLTFNGNDVVAPTLASPQFASNDYGSTPFATAAGAFPKAPFKIQGPGGVLSQDDAGNLLQLQDATMRAQFNKTGSSTFHLLLHPNVLPAVTIDVPSSQGVLLTTGRGVTGADINVAWWVTRIQRLITSADPTHLPIYLTNNVYLHIGPNPLNCCIIGFHGAGLVPGRGAGSTHGNGNQEVQTYAWASWVQPGFYARANGGTDWALQDIHALSHEIAEWADDPFVNNRVEPWLTPTAPQYGCTNLLETGDPVVAIGFAKGTNTFEQGPNPNGTQSADGFYHPEDEAYLPWFMRTAPNTISEPTQSASTNVGRYTLMGDLNPFPGFRAPATGC